MTTETVAEQARDRVRAAVKAKKEPRRAKKTWVAPGLDDFALGTALCFDQTLTKSGFAVVRRDGAGLHVLDGGLLTFPVPAHLKGFERTFYKADHMDQRIRSLMMLLGSEMDVIVHEMPAVVGWRIESSLMAAQSVRLAARDHARGVPVSMVSHQSAAAILCPLELRGEKRHITAAVEALVPRENRRTKRWNQDVHDGVALGLAYLYTKQRSIR